METLVRCEINLVGLRKIVVCCRFPENYPGSALLIELKSKTLSESFLQKLTKAADIEASKHLKKPQVLKIVKFLKQFLVDNPLSVCYNEILDIKKSLAFNDEIKLRQATSTVVIHIREGNYFLKVKINVPAEYFKEPASITNSESNFPLVMEKFLLAQCNVIGKQCTEPSSTRLVKFKDGKERPVAGKIVKVQSTTEFQESPSLAKIVQFLLMTCRKFVAEYCQVCQKKCLPDDPQTVEQDEQAGDHVERVYCGHLFHLSCLLTFMKTPPFQGGKKCGSCGEILSHYKWKLNERQAEDRWAHEQARDRELQEVAEFFN